MINDLRLLIIKYQAPYKILRINFYQQPADVWNTLKHILLFLIFFTILLQQPMSLNASLSSI